VRETVPGGIVRQAAEIVAVDVTPDALLSRLKRRSRFSVVFFRLTVPVKILSKGTRIPIRKQGFAFEDLREVLTRRDIPSVE
jgi:Osmosensitive K+ channel His kinase sensor domain